VLAVINHGQTTVELTLPGSPLFAADRATAHPPVAADPVPAAAVPADLVPTVAVTTDPDAVPAVSSPTVSLAPFDYRLLRTP